MAEPGQVEVAGTIQIQLLMQGMPEAVFPISPDLEADG
jgi:hypothetical protein